MKHEDVADLSSETGNWSYLLVQEKIEKLPFCEDCQEGLPDSYLKVYSNHTEIRFNESDDIVFETEDDLVAKYYRKLGKACPLPIHTYVDMYGKTFTGVDGIGYPITELLMYYSYYGIEIENLYFIRILPVVMAVCENEEQVCQLIKQSPVELHNPRVIPVKTCTPLTENIEFNLP